MPEEVKIGIRPRAHVTLLYTGDLHGRAEKMAFISTVIKERRIEGGTLFLVDSGDWSKGTPVTDDNEGKPMAEIMEYLRYDAAALGEEDLSWGIEILGRLAAMTSFPFLASNLKGAIPASMKPFTIREGGGLKLALIGVSPPANLPERDCYMVPPEEGIRESLEALLHEEPDLIVLLSHLGIEHDREIARLFPSIQVIIGGHSHVVTEKPEEIGSTLIVHGGAYGEYLGSLSLDVGATVTIGSGQR
jgi:2',3'-cyclic-nucleotide 2'-phosphodiesterase (5'-nucleotidase family)